MKTQSTIEALAYLERAAADLQQAQQDAADRPRLYRLHHLPPRQPADIVMCRWLSDWLCEYWQQQASMK